jgi:hypothetical protein
VTSSTTNAATDEPVVLDRYRLDALLDNTRPWAELWLGEDRLLQRQVVVRLLTTGDPHTAPAIAAARHAATFDDARCVRVLDVAEEAAIPERGGLPAGSAGVVVRAWVDGTSLGEILHDAPMDATEATDLVADVADVIARTHAAGLSHAALDPQHVLLTRDGDIAILDLGIAEVLHADDPSALGTGSAAHDVRAVGALLYACLTGRWPLDSPSPLDPAETIGDGADARPLPPRRMRAGVPTALDAMCRRALGEVVGGEPPFDDARSLAVELRRWLFRAGASNSDLVTRRAATGAGEPRAAASTSGPRAVKWIVGVIAAALLIGLAVLGVQVLDAVFGEPEGSPPPGPTAT